MKKCLGDREEKPICPYRERLAKVSILQPAEGLMGPVTGQSMEVTTPAAYVSRTLETLLNPSVPRWL